MTPLSVRSRMRISLILILFIGASSILPSAAQTTDLVPLAEPGSFSVGRQDPEFSDPSRQDYDLRVSVWYPALTKGRDAVPDVSGAPYPLILYSHGHGGNRQEMAHLAAHLVSHGFVFAAMDHTTDSLVPNYDAVDRPLDVLFVLNQLASMESGPLAGMIDSGRVGVAGYSEGSFTALMLTGARVHPSAHAAWCAEHEFDYPRVCIGAENDALVDQYLAQVVPAAVPGEPWPAFSDTRIKAIVAYTGGPGLVFGDEGLAEASVPTLIMAGTSDLMAPYPLAAVYVFDHLGSPERYLISVIGGQHGFGMNHGSLFEPVILHFTTAFFGYYVQGRPDYAQHLTESAVNAVDSLVWGAYMEP